MISSCGILLRRKRCFSLLWLRGGFRRMSSTPEGFKWLSKPCLFRVEMLNGGFFGRLNLILGFGGRDKIWPCPRLSLWTWCEAEENCVIAQFFTRAGVHRQQQRLLETGTCVLPFVNRAQSWTFEKKMLTYRRTKSGVKTASGLGPFSRILDLSLFWVWAPDHQNPWSAPWFRVWPPDRNLGSVNWFRVWAPWPESWICELAQGLGPLTRILDLHLGSGSGPPDQNPGSAPVEVWIPWPESWICILVQGLASWAESWICTWVSGFRINNVSSIPWKTTPEWMLPNYPRLFSLRRKHTSALHRSQSSAKTCSRLPGKTRKNILLPMRVANPIISITMIWVHSIIWNKGLSHQTPRGGRWAPFTQDAEHLATGVGVFTQLGSNVKGFACKSALRMHPVWTGPFTPRMLNFTFGFRCEWRAECRVQVVCL